MRLVSVGEAGRERPGVLVGERVVLLSELEGHLAWGDGLRTALAAGALDAIRQACEDLRPDFGHPAEELRFGPPIVDPRSIICVGLNYRGHAEEQDKPWPERPMLFSKAPSALSGWRDDIVLPAADPETVDYEVELVAVIGRGGRDIPESEAMDHVAGYLVANDVSHRRWQKADGQFFRAKSCDTFFPCGQALVTVDEVDDYRELRLTTTIGGEVLQDSLAGDLIHDLPTLISYISRSMTLAPGDLLSTGTPAGVGCFRDPPRFLAPGDEVVCTITGLGETRNRVVGG